MAVVNEKKFKVEINNKDCKTEINNTMECKLSSETMTTDSFYEPEDEFSLNDVLSKKLEVDAEALEKAICTINSLEIKLRESDTERIRLLKELEENKTVLSETESKVVTLNNELENYRDKVVPALEVKNKELQRDMETMGEKMIDEAERCSELLHSKQLLEAEIEDLSQKLFEEANGMVADERKLNYDWSVKFEKLKSHLADTKNLLEFEKDQSRELKSRLSTLLEPGNTETNSLSPAFKSRSRRSSSVNASPLLRSITSSDSIVFDPSQCSSETYTDSNTFLAYKLDDIRFLEFKGFVLAHKSKGIYLASTFMKRSLAEDVDPTLKFHPKGSTWSSLKSLSVAAQVGNVNLVTNRIQLERHINCSLCSAVLPTPYAFSIKDQTGPNQPICVCCRDRLLTVCEFYALVRIVRAGVIKQSVEEMYLDCLKIKHKMFLARVGASFVDMEINEAIESGFNQESEETSTSRSTPTLKVIPEIGALRESRSMPVSPLATTFDQNAQEKTGFKDCSSDIQVTVYGVNGEKKEPQTENLSNVPASKDTNKPEEINYFSHQHDISNNTIIAQKIDLAPTNPTKSQANLPPVPINVNIDPWASTNVEEANDTFKVDSSNTLKESDELLQSPDSTSSSLLSPAAGPPLPSFTN